MRLLILILLLSGCKGIFHEEYRGKNVFEISHGEIDFFDTKTAKDTVVTKYFLNKSYSDTCFFIRSFKLKETDFSNIAFGLVLYEKYRRYKLFDFRFIVNGSPEKIMNFECFIINKKGDSIKNMTQFLTSINPNIGALMLRNENDSNIIYSMLYSTQNKCCTWNHTFLSVPDFIYKYNNQFTSIDQDRIGNNTFLFGFKDSWLTELGFQPYKLSIHIELKVPSKKRIRRVIVNTYFPPKHINNFSVYKF